MRSAAALFVTAALALGACSSQMPVPFASDTADQPTVTVDLQPESRLPDREGPRRETTGTVPHVQLNAAPVPEVDAELLRRAFLLPGVERRESVRSLPGATGLWLAADMDLARRDVLMGSREFAHIHPDGSLHVWLPTELAQEVEATKWGELHPWVGRDGFWDGVAMIYTPETLDELDITIQVVVEAYNFVVGASIDPAQIT